MNNKSSNDNDKEFDLKSWLYYSQRKIDQNISNNQKDSFVNCDSVEYHYNKVNEGKKCNALLPTDWLLS